MKTKEEIEKLLLDQFGLNAGFVSEIYEKYIEDNNSVSDYWKSFFKGLLSNGKNNIDVTKQKLKSAVPKEAALLDIAGDETEIITGVGAKIIENMEQSLSIPTATSLRTISVKLLEENRRIINQNEKLYVAAG